MKSFILGLLLVVVASSGQAAGLIEPYVGYGFGKFEINNAGGSQEADANGVGLGVRLGVALPLVFFGLEGSYSMPDIEFDNNGGDYEGKQKSFGVFAGVALPIGIRAWGAYHFINELEMKPATGTNTEYEGSMYKLGLGFRLIPLLYLNAEYIINDYDEVNGNNLTNDVDHNTIFLSLSVPLSL